MRCLIAWNGNPTPVPRINPNRVGHNEYVIPKLQKGVFIMQNQNYNPNKQNDKQNKQNDKQNNQNKTQNCPNRQDNNQHEQKKNVR